MAPPEFQDCLAEDPELERELRELDEALDECEDDLAAVERDVAALRLDLREFLAFLQDCPGVTPNDLIRFFQRLAQQEMRFRATLDHCLRDEETRRQAVAALPETRLKARLLKIYDRRIAVLRSAVDTCETGKRSLLAMSDELALLESQGMFLDPFWSDRVH